MTLVEQMVTVEEDAMVPLSISPMIALMVTVNLWQLGNIFILLMKIQALIFLVQPRSSAKIVSALLREIMGSIITTTLLLNTVLVLPNQNILTTNMMTLPLHKATLLHLQILPVIAKGSNQAMKSL